MKDYSEGRLTVLLTKKALKIKVFDELVADTPAKALVLLDGNAWDFYNRIAFRKSGRGVFRRTFRRRADAAYVETYRSGHNGAHSKCVSRGNRLEGSNPSVSARFHEVTPIFCTAMYNEWGYLYANNKRDNDGELRTYTREYKLKAIKRCMTGILERGRQTKKK